MRPVAEVHGDAEILRVLADHDFPAERSDTSPATVHGVGRLLGRLRTLPATEGAVSRPADGLVVQAWGVAFRGAMPSAVLQWLAAERKTTELVVERTRKAFEARP